ncbi:MAG: extracellular solute-binding protein [Anaerolineales bacterium]|nr:extracellular solute-binding protein [Anaerolineales bacterium]
MTIRKIPIAILLFVFIFSACTPTTTDSNTQTPRPSATANAEDAKTPTPEASQLGVEKDALRGKQVNIWHPWFGAQASLFESQVAQFNAENEWGIVVVAESKNNYNEIFSQTSAALENSSAPQIVIALPEHALAWGDDVTDLNPYVHDPEFGMSALEMSDFANVIWRQDEVGGKRFGAPAQRTARFILYNSTWARGLGFDSPPQNSSEFEAQACAAHDALTKDSDPNNDSLGGWLIDSDAHTALAWMLAFDGGAQEENGYRFLAPGNIDAFKFLKSLQQKSCAWVASPDLSVYDRFAARQALFATASLEEFSDQARAFFAASNTDEWIAIPFPGAERDALVVYGSSFIVFNSNDETQLASWLFIRWMLSSETQADWVRTTGLFPLRSSTFDLLADYSADHPQWADAVTYLSDGDVTPQLSSWRLVRVMLADGFRDMFDSIRHPDLTEGQVPLILKQMDDTAEELSK